MAEETTYVSDEEDMAAFDELPYALKKFLDDMPVGVEATPVLELYKQKLAQGWDASEAVDQIMKALKQLMNQWGIKDQRPLRLRPGAKPRRKERRIRLPKKLMQVGDGG